MNATNSTDEIQRSKVSIATDIAAAVMILAWATVIYGVSAGLEEAEKASPSPQTAQDAVDRS